MTICTVHNDCLFGRAAPRALLSDLRFHTRDCLFDAVDQEVLSVESCSLQSHLHVFSLEEPRLLIRCCNQLNLLFVSLQVLTNAYDSLLYILVTPLAGFFNFLHHILQAFALLTLLAPISEHLASLVLLLLSAQDLLLSALFRFLQLFRLLLSALEIMLESLKLFLELFQLLFLLELFKSSLLSLNLLLQELFL